MKLVDLRPDTTRYELTAVIDTALCIGAGGSSGSLADKPIVRNAKGCLIIPGSHLKGRLRHECEKIARALGWTVSESPNPQSMMVRNQGGQSFAIPDQNQSSHCIISTIFGNPALPACLLVDDLICVANPESLPSEVIRPGVSLNRRRRTAEDQKLYYLETSPANMQLEFTGEIHLINPPPYAAALIVAGLKHIKALGGSKSAGLGWLSWELPPDFVTAAQDKVAWRMLGSSTNMKRINLKITAHSPLAIGRQKPGGSISQVESYIPGVVIRGAIASLMLRQSQQNDTDFAAESDSDFKALFINGKALFLNAYPAIAEIGDVLQVQPEVRVLPATALSAKNGGGFKPKNGVFDSLIDRFCGDEFDRIYDPNCPKDGGRVDPFKGFYSRDSQGRYHSHSASTRLLTRVGINRRRATAEEKILYSIEVLEESKKHTPTSGDITKQFIPMVFASSILVEAKLAEKLYRYIQDYSDEFRLGNSASRGLGKVEIHPEIQDIPNSIKQRVDEFNQALEQRWSLWQIFDSTKFCPTTERTFFTLGLQSDAILTEQWRRTTVISEAMLQKRLQALLKSTQLDAIDGQLKLHAADTSYDYRSGWNAAWGLMKDVELTTDRSSVYLFSVEQEHQEGWLSALKLLEVWGVGDRTTEGFGQIKVCDEFHCIFREEPA